MKQYKTSTLGPINYLLDLNLLCPFFDYNLYFTKNYHLNLYIF
jgi:hypothetical protein